MMSDEIKQAIEALKPFANVACGWDESMPDSTLMADFNYEDDEGGCFITLGQCRRAREAATALDRLSGRVTVKALEFTRYGEAHGLGGKYVVYEGGGGWRALFYPAPADPNETIAERVTEAEAYAAVHRHHEARILAAINTAPTPSPDQDSLQARVKPWLLACFGEEIAGDKLERGDRLLEEVFELLQSGGYPSDRIASLRDYVWSRDIGAPHQEAGAVMITLAAYCLAHGLDMHAAAEDELARIWTKVEKIRAKQAAKPAGSALPISVEHTPSPDQIRREAARSLLADFEAEKLPEHAIDAADDMHSEGDSGNTSDIIEAFLKALITGGDDDAA